MLFKALKGQENSYFNVCVMINKRHILYYLRASFLILIITNDICICKSKQSNKTSFFEVLKENKNFTNIHRSNRLNDKDFHKYLDQHLLEMNETNMFEATHGHQETFDTLKHDKSSKGSFTTHHSSQLGNLIQLLSQHSSEVLKNNNHTNKESINKHTSILHTLSNFDPLKDDTNMSDSYYDILYDLDLEIDQGGHEKANESTREDTINCDLDPGDRVQKINEYDKSKK